MIIYNSQEKARCALLEKLQRLLSKVDATLLTSHQKLRIYRDGISPRLTWDLSTADISISWVKKDLDFLVVRHLKQWTELAKSTNTSHLLLPKSMGGLQLPLISTIYKKLQSTKAASLMSSRDPLVRHLASQKTLAEASTVRQSFRPYQQVVEVLREDPGASQKVIVAYAKSAVVQADTQIHFKQCSRWVVQGQTMRQFQDRAELWAHVVTSLPESTMRVALKSVTDTLPHNAHIHLRGKQPSPVCQLWTFQHVLNHCSTALEKRHYNRRHDDILASLYSFVTSHLRSGDHVTADLPDVEYCFPQDVAITDRRPDLVIWSDSSICLVELTIPFEAGMVTAAERKQVKYEDLLAMCATSHRRACLATIEVGFINPASLDKLYGHLTPSTKKKRHALGERDHEKLHHALSWSMVQKKLDK